MNDTEQRERFDKLEAMMDKLAQQMVTGFARIDERLDQTASKEQVNAIYDLLDKNITEHEKQEIERAAMAHQLSRHDIWVHQLADHAGVELRQHG